MPVWIVLFFGAVSSFREMFLLVSYFVPLTNVSVSSLFFRMLPKSSLPSSS